MKAIRLITVTVLFFVSLTLSAQGKKEQADKKKAEKVTFLVSMHCENCKAKIEKNISWEKGVKDLSVDLDKKTVAITYNTQNTTEEKLKDAIVKLGFKAEVIPAKSEASK